MQRKLCPTFTVASESRKDVQMKVSDPFFDWLTIFPELLSCFDLVTPARSQECQEQHRQKKRQLGGIHAEEWNRVAMAQRYD